MYVWVGGGGGEERGERGVEVSVEQLVAWKEGGGDEGWTKGEGVR